MKRSWVFGAMPVAAATCAMAAVTACGSSSGGVGATSDGGGDAADHTEAGAAEAGADAQTVAETGAPDAPSGVSDAAPEAGVTPKEAGTSEAGVADAGPDASGTPVSVSAGAGTACAVTAGGGVACWSASSSQWSAATPLPGGLLSSGVKTVAVGGANGFINGPFVFQCVVDANGGVEAWGDDHYNQLGNGSMTGSTIPGLIPSLASGVSSLSAGAGDWPAACAVTASGGVRCWGMGLGAAGTTPTPAAVTGFTGAVSSVSVGGFGDGLTDEYGFACAVTASGAAECWGGNTHGELGNGTNTGSVTPVPVTGLGSGIAAITAGYDSACALTAAGAVQCWGANDVGQIGNGSTTPSAVPVQVMGLTSGVVAVSSAGNTTCAITSGGGVSCWGANNNGQLGNGSTLQSLTPVAVTVSVKVVAA